MYPSQNDPTNASIRLIAAFHLLLPSVELNNEATVLQCAAAWNSSYLGILSASFPLDLTKTLWTPNIFLSFLAWVNSGAPVYLTL